MTLTEFLLARIDEDEAPAAHCLDLERRFPIEGDREYRWVLLFSDSSSRFATGVPSPARVLAECAAKRIIVEMHRPFGEVHGLDAMTYPEGAGFCAICGPGDTWEAREWIEIGEAPGPCETVRALASVYSDHPDFDPSWASAGSGSTPT